MHNEWCVFRDASLWNLIMTMIIIKLNKIKVFLFLIYYCLIISVPDIYFLKLIYLCGLVYLTYIDDSLIVLVISVWF